MLKRLIAHQIIKEKNTTSASLTVRETVLPAKSDLAVLLINQLSDSFKTRNPFAGLFRLADAAQETTEAPKKKKKKPISAFRQNLLDYLAAPGDNAFADFTKLAAEILRSEIASQSLATGGYIVFAEYSAARDNYLMTSLLTTQATPSFDKDLNLVETEPLDFEHLRHGARIRLNRVKQNREGVMQLISRRADGVSDYFVEFLGCEPVLRPSAQGQLLFSVLNSLKVTEAVRTKIKEGAFRKASEARDENRTITLTEIAEAAPPKERKRVLEYLTSEEHDLAGEFYPPSPAVMKQFVRFAFDGQGLRLEFDINPWANRMNVDKQNTLTITKVPPELVAQLREEIGA